MPKKVAAALVVVVVRRLRNRNVVADVETERGRVDRGFTQDSRDDVPPASDVNRFPDRALGIRAGEQAVNALSESTHTGAEAATSSALDGIVRQSAAPC